MRDVLIPEHSQMIKSVVLVTLTMVLMIMKRKKGNVCRFHSKIDDDQRQRGCLECCSAHSVHRLSRAIVSVVVVFQEEPTVCCFHWQSVWRYVVAETEMPKKWREFLGRRKVQFGSACAKSRRVGARRVFWKALTSQSDTQKEFRDVCSKTVMSSGTASAHFFGQGIMRRSQRNQERRSLLRLHL